jgi:hypothetical protein
MAFSAVRPFKLLQARFGRASAPPFSPAFLGLVKRASKLNGPICRHRTLRGIDKNQKVMTALAVRLCIRWSSFGMRYPGIICQFRSCPASKSIMASAVLSLLVRDPLR